MHPTPVCINNISTCRLDERLKRLEEQADGCPYDLKKEDDASGCRESWCNNANAIGNRLRCRWTCNPQCNPALPFVSYSSATYVPAATIADGHRHCDDKYTVTAQEKHVYSGTDKPLNRHKKVPVRVAVCGKCVSNEYSLHPAYASGGKVSSAVLDACPPSVVVMVVVTSTMSLLLSDPGGVPTSGGARPVPRDGRHLRHRRQERRRELLLGRSHAPEVPGLRACSRLPAQRDHARPHWQEFVKEWGAMQHTNPQSAAWNGYIDGVNVGPDKLKDHGIEDRALAFTCAHVSVTDFSSDVRHFTNGATPASVTVYRLVRGEIAECHSQRESNPHDLGCVNKQVVKSCHSKLVQMNASGTYAGWSAVQAAWIALKPSVFEAVRRTQPSRHWWPSH